MNNKLFEQQEDCKRKPKREHSDAVLHEQGGGAGGLESSAK